MSSNHRAIMPDNTGYFFAHKDRRYLYRELPKGLQSPVIGLDTVKGNAVFCYTLLNISNIMESEILTAYYHQYLVSSDGTVINTKTGRKLKSHEYRHGYLYYHINTPENPGRRMTVHRLMAKLFIPNPQNKREVNHKDGNKRNNSLENLEWVTRSENELHARYILGVCRKMPPGLPRGKDNPRSRPVIKIDPFDNVEICTYVNISLAAWDIGIHYTDIRQAIISGGVCKYFKWKYADKYSKIQNYLNERI